MMDSDVFFNNTFTNGVLPETHVFHAGCRSVLAPVHTALIVIVNWCGKVSVAEADIQTVEANGEDFFGTFVRGTNFSLT